MSHRYVATLDGHWVKPQAFALLGKFLVVVYLARLYWVFPEILLPHMPWGVPVKVVGSQGPHVSQVVIRYNRIG